MITFQEEVWHEVWRELAGYWQDHWEEVGGDKVHLKLDPDIDKMNYLSEQGKFHLVTARKDGEIIAYHVSVIDTLLHYKSILVASADMYFVHPSHRKGIVGIRLFQKVEATCKARGIQMLFTATKLKLDVTYMLTSKHLGYTYHENRLMKWIGEE